VYRGEGGQNQNVDREMGILTSGAVQSSCGHSVVDIGGPCCRAGRLAPVWTTASYLMQNPGLMSMS
jgi:hypothetical protein